MTNKLVLWGAGTSRSLRPIWVAEELGIDYQLRPIGPRTGETKTPEYLQLNPKQKIPILVDGDFVLSETVAICRYLVNRFGSDSTIPAAHSIEERAREDEWISYIYGEIDETSLYVMRRHLGLPEVYGEAPVAVDSARQYAAKHLGVVNQYLAGKQYLLNERFSLPDIFLTSCLGWAEAYGIPLLPELDRYRDVMTKRPAFIRADAINRGKA